MGTSFLTNMFVYIDGTDFKTYDGFICEEYYDTKSHEVDAIITCRKDIKCSMISVSSCNDKSTEYRLCGQSPKLIPHTPGCTHRKKGIVRKQSL